MLKPLLALLLLSTTPAFADDLRESYTARLSAKDHFNSSGERLKTAAAIIRQDRANYHKFDKGDQEDENDTFFSSAENRAVLEKQLERGSNSGGALRTIVNGTPLIKVSVYTDDNTGQDYVRVKIIEE